MADPADPCPPERPSAGFTRIPTPTGPGPRRDCDACVHRILDPRFGLRARRLPLRHADVLLDDAAVEERVALCDECHRRFEAQDGRITAAVDRARRGLAQRRPLPADALYALLDTVILQDLLHRPAPARRPRSLVQKRRDRAVPATPARAPSAPEQGEVLGYADISPMVRRRAGPPQSDDPDYRHVVAAAFVVYRSPRSPGRNRDRPTVGEVQSVLDRWQGLQPTGTGNTLRKWFDRWRGRTKETLTVQSALDDARRLRDAEQAIREGGISTRRHTTDTKPGGVG